MTKSLSYSTSLPLHICPHSQLWPPWVRSTSMGRCSAEKSPICSSLPAFALFIIGHRWQQTSRSIPLCRLTAAGSCWNRRTSQGNSPIPLLHRHDPLCKGGEEQRCRSPAASHPGISSREGLVTTRKQALDLLQSPMLQDDGMNRGTVEGARNGPGDDQDL